MPPKEVLFQWNKEHSEYSYRRAESQRIKKEWQRTRDMDESSHIHYTTDVMTYVIVIFLILVSGLFSGLTLGLMSLDKNELRRKISLGNKEAKKVYAVRKHGNLLLCTLLLGNVGVNSTIAIFLGTIANGVVAGVVATGLIVVFGEILPQASFARYALKVGAKTAWIVRFFIILLFPVCWPIAWLLDKALGDEVPTIYSKKELMKIIEEHEDTESSDIDSDEERIILGALSFSEKKAKQIMTPRTVVFALNIDSALNNRQLEKIKREGFSRIPVYKKSIDNIVGILYVKDLITMKKGTSIKDLYRKEHVLNIPPDTKLDHLLTFFTQSKSHIAIIRDEYNGFEGVVTLEDVVEEVLKIEIVDESDTVTDLRKKARQKRRRK
jgi:metal transporter CNNM